MPYYGGRPGNGLIVLSRFPPIEERWQTFSCGLSRLRRGGSGQVDGGILLVRVQTPQGLVDVYDTRLIADEPAAKYKTLRMTQIFDLADMVKTYSADRPFLLMGDLGQEADHQLLTDLLGLKHPLLPSPPEVEQAHFPPEQLRPIPSRRIDALNDIAAAAERMIETFRRRLDAGSWIPIYGFMLTLRYERQINQLEMIVVRAETARIDSLGAAYAKNERPPRARRR